jgi:hypothetical protein
MDRVMDDCEEPTWTPEAVAMLFDDDYVPQIIPRVALAEMRAFWLRPFQSYRQRSDVSDTTPDA